MDKLTDDLLVDIFSRVPYKSVRRFSCVSRRWSALIAHPDNRRKLPQTLAGFFYRARDLRFADVAGTGPPFFDPSLGFLPNREWEGLYLADGCNGLLLYRCYRFADPSEFDYIVINPATEEWVAVPVTRRLSDKVGVVRLGFDPAASSHFYVFEFQLDWADDDEDSQENDDKDGHVLGVAIYSSESRAWSHKQSGWSFEVTLTDDCKSVFVNGMLYVVANELVIGTVDAKGKTWRTIEFPINAPFLPLLGTCTLICHRDSCILQLQQMMV